jgi:hypothetical protein
VAFRYGFQTRRQFEQIIALNSFGSIGKRPNARTVVPIFLVDETTIRIETFILWLAENQRSGGDAKEGTR